MANIGLLTQKIQALPTGSNLAISSKVSSADSMAIISSRKLKCTQLTVNPSAMTFMLGPSVLKSTDLFRTYQKNIYTDMIWYKPTFIIKKKSWPKLTPPISASYALPYEIVTSEYNIHMAHALPLPSLKRIDRCWYVSYIPWQSIKWKTTFLRFAYRYIRITCNCQKFYCGEIRQVLKLNINFFALKVIKYLVIRHVSLNIMGKIITLKPNILTRTRTQNIFRICNLCSCNLPAETNNSVSVPSFYLAQLLSYRNHLHQTSKPGQTVRFMAFVL